MRKLHILGMMLGVLFALSAVAATSAFALESTWLVDGAKPAAAVASVSKGTNIILSDDKLKAAVLCEVESTGTVGPGPADTVEVVTFRNCVTVEGCTAVDNVVAINLPWATKVVLDEATKFLDEVSEGASKAGAPGYLIECVSAGILLDDSCTKAEASTALSNETATEVDALFEGLEEAKCSLGGEKGLVTGLVLTSLTGANLGLTLAVSEG